MCNLLTGGIDFFIVESPQPVAYMEMSQTFARWLVEKVRQAGVEVREVESTVAIQEWGEGVEVATGKGRYRARVVIGSDGAMSVVAPMFPRARCPKYPCLGK
ncbi:MAG: hypothetical protein H0X47_05350 [Nitrospirales bacterium]|nr:hypothetical protein [Nitrospirales bacterium]